MPASKKPRKKYRPKPIMLNAIEFVKESIKPLSEHDSYVVDWRLKNNEAFAKLLRGQAARSDLDTMVAARNICEAVVKTKYKAEDDTDGTLVRSEAALLDICERANAGKGTAMKAPEMQAIRDLMTLHDTLLESVNVREFEAALRHAKTELMNGRAKRLKAVSQ